MTVQGGTRALEDIVVVPRNGYVNRLQAWASSAILAAELDVPLRVAWEPEPVAPADFIELFAPPRPGLSLIEANDLRIRLGDAHENLPRYLSVDEGRRLVVLAGHDRGEQAFMEQLLPALEHACQPTTLLIVAGGHFHLPGSTGFEAQRRHFYRQLPWSEAVRSGTDTVLAGRADFLGLHVRQTDRSVSAPRPRAIRAAIGALARQTRVRSVFVAADTDEARERWLAELADLGLDGWAAPDPALDRSTARAGVDAMIDWRVLSRSRALVYSRASSFGEEAAVAADAVQLSLPLTASESLQRSRRAAAVGRSLVTYPRRRLAQGRKPS
jgi:hypothetical protein